MRFYRAFAARQQDAREAKPHRSRVADESGLDPLPVNTSDSPARNVAAASVALLREPVRHPAGSPDRAFSYGRPRPSRAPVPPVLSGSDQASATPPITISHPLTGSKAWESIMRLW